MLGDSLNITLDQEYLTMAGCPEVTSVICQRRQSAKRQCIGVEQANHTRQETMKGGAPQLRSRTPVSAPLALSGKAYGKLSTRASKKSGNASADD